MRRLTFALAASAAAALFATAADARPGIGGASHRVGGEASTKAAEGSTLIETVATFFGFSVTAKAAPTVGTDAPRSAAPRTEQCEEEKKRAEAAKASETRRTAQAEKRQRGGEPVYLAF
jgi:hypothetical protein